MMTIAACATALIVAMACAPSRQQSSLAPSPSDKSELVAAVDQTLSARSYRVRVRIEAEGFESQEPVTDRWNLEGPRARTTYGDSNLDEQLAIGPHVYRSVEGNKYELRKMASSRDALVLVDPSFRELEMVESAEDVRRVKDSISFRIKGKNQRELVRGNVALRNGRVDELVTRSGDAESNYRFQYIDVPPIKEPARQDVVSPPPVVTCLPSGDPPPNVPACAT